MKASDKLVGGHPLIETYCEVEDKNVGDNEITVKISKSTVKKIPKQFILSFSDASVNKQELRHCKMGKNIYLVFISTLLLFFSGCSNYEQGKEIDMESSSSIKYIKGTVKEINNESFVIENNEELSISMDSDDKEISKKSRIFIFIPFKENQNEVLNKLKINDYVSVGYSNISITNGVYVMTLIENSQVTILENQ